MTFRLRHAVLAAGLALATAAAAIPAQAETLTDALISAYRNSHLLDQNRALLRAADEDVATAVAALRPVLNYAVSASKNYNALGDTYSATLGLTAQMVLFDFGRSRLAIDIAKETVLSTQSALVGIEQNVLYNAVAAYMNVILTGEVVRLRQNNVRLIDQELSAANDRFNLGEITRTDVSQAEARLAAARAELASAQGDLQSAREQYRAYVGHYPTSLAEAPALPKTAGSLDAAKAIALKTHPSIKQAQRQVNASELGIEVALAGMKPSVTGGVQGQLNREGDKTSALTLQLSGPIYQGGKLSAGYRKAVAQRDASRANLLQVANTVEQNVGLAWAQVQVSNAQIGASDRQIRASSVAYRGVREEANLGSRTTLDVLNAEQELLDAQSSRITAYTNYYTATYALLREMGLLTVDHLGLGIPTYDPEGYYNAVKDAPVRQVSPQGAKLDRVLRALGK